MPNQLLSLVEKVVDAICFNIVDSGVEEERGSVENDGGHIMSLHDRNRMRGKRFCYLKQRRHPVSGCCTLRVQLRGKRRRQKVDSKRRAVMRQAEKPIGIDIELDRKQGERTEIGHAWFIWIDPSRRSLNGATRNLAEVVDLMVPRNIAHRHFGDQAVANAGNQVKINMLSLEPAQHDIAGCLHMCKLVGTSKGRPG